MQIVDDDGVLLRLSRPLAQVPGRELTGQVLALRVLADRVEAAYLDAVAELDARGQTSEHGLSTSAWLTEHARTSPAENGLALRMARTMTSTPALHDAVRDGRVRPAHLRMVVEARAVVTPRVLADTAPGLVAACVAAHPGQLRTALRSLGEAVDDAAARRAHDRAGLVRWLDVCTTFEGATSVQGVLDADAGQVLREAIGALSGPSDPDDTRAAPVRRADALVELARRSLDSGTLPRTAGQRPHVTITATLADLVAVRAGTTARPGPGPGSGSGSQHRHVDAASPDEPRSGPSPTDRAPSGHRGWPPRPPEPSWIQATYPDGSPVTRSVLARYLCEASLTSVLLDRSSRPVDVGRTRRLATPAARRALTLRDRGCRYPGCTAPATWCDAHHIEWWERGGRSDLDNLVLLCRRHHTLVHDGTVQVRPLTEPPPTDHAAHTTSAVPSTPVIRGHGVPVTFTHRDGTIRTSHPRFAAPELANVVRGTVAAPALVATRWGVARLPRPDTSPRRTSAGQDGIRDTTATEADPQLPSATRSAGPRRRAGRRHSHPRGPSQPGGTGHPGGTGADPDDTG